MSAACGPRGRPGRLPEPFSYRGNHPKEAACALLPFNLFGPHCIVGTPDAEVVDPLNPQPGDFQIRKRWYSGFQGTRVASLEDAVAALRGEAVAAS